MFWKHHLAKAAWARCGAHEKDGDARLPAVAIKIPSAMFTVKGGMERLAREGEILASLNHPNIARLIEIGQHTVGDLRIPFWRWNTCKAYRSMRMQPNTTWR